MPLYALDSENRIVSAAEASSMQSYRCVECQKTLKKRFGKHRRPHFYHLETTPHCRLYSRSLDHLAVQAILLQMLPFLKAERRFPNLLRIADLCWEEKKLIFEIQCSPIKSSEVEARNRDYSQEGYEVVWLLDERLFNKRQLRIAEELLRSSCCYFFSLKKGIVYDQFELIFQGKRLLKGAHLFVDLSKPYRLKNLPLQWLQQLQHKKSRLYFANDLTSHALHSQETLEKLLELERETLKKQKRECSWLFALKRLFYTAFEHLLSRCCR